MNIDNSMGMALFSSDSSAVFASGNSNSLANGPAEGPEGSLFQQLISQMMAKNKMIETMAVNGNGTTQDKSGEQSPPGVQAAEQASTEESSIAAEELQAFMASYGNPMQTANTEKNLPDTQSVKAAAQQQATEILQKPGIDVEAPANQSGKYRQDHAALATENRQEVNKATTEVTKAKANETTILNDESTVLQPKETARIQTTGNSEKAGTEVIDKLDAVKAGQKGKPETLDVISGQEFKATETANNRQTAAAGIQMKETAAGSIEQDDIVGATEKMKPEIESKGISPERAEFHHLMQGCTAARETAETNPQTQTIESSQPYSQIKDEILTKLEKNGPTEFKMQLDPKELGQIDIKLKLSEGKLIIDILAANSRTQALLTGQAEKLIASMGLQNVTVESIQVSQQMNSQANDSGQNQGFTMNAAMDFSQRKQQEQNQQQFSNDSKPAGIFSRQPDEAQINSRADSIGATQYDFHRMNYAV